MISSSVCGFPPISAARPRILVLGSMPGEKSLAAAQYYAHPQNAFWPLMARLFGQPADSYAERQRLIRGNGLALWDVLAQCVRPGSLDSNIKSDSIVVNDFAAFLTRRKTITHVFFNGGAAESLFRRHVIPSLHTDVLERLTFARLPSTSPAMAMLTFDGKFKLWRAAFKRAQAVHKGHAGDV